MLTTYDKWLLPPDGEDIDEDLMLTSVHEAIYDDIQGENQGQKLDTRTIEAVLDHLMSNDTIYEVLREQYSDEATVIYQARQRELRELRKAKNPDYF